MSKLIISIIFLGLIQHALVAPTIEHNVVTKLRQKPTVKVNVLVSMKGSTQSVIRDLRLKTFPTRADRLNSVAHALMDLAAASQKNVIDLLKKEKEEQPDKPFSFKAFWITNQIFIYDADIDTLQKVVALNEVSKIEEEKVIYLEEPIDLKVFDDLGPQDRDEVQWGVQQIEAPTLWKEGNLGQNITIATVDTGARGTHEALRHNFAGEYGWFDPSGKTLEPNDGNGHGTHTTANIAGTMRNVGVAPGSKWAACKGCEDGSCFPPDLLSCGQWVLCPTKADGTGQDCSKAPHIVSNSWGGGRGYLWYQEVIDAYQVAGIIPMFSVGNSGPACGSTNSPGDYDNVIGIGSTTIDNQLSFFSSVGPTVIGHRMKPDIVAPGSNVFSAYHTSDTAYASMSGTSMACPHAAGVVALLLKENPNLTYPQVLASVTGGSVSTTETGKNCQGVPESNYPNHHVGHGRINAVKTVDTMKRLFGN